MSQMLQRIRMLISTEDVRISAHGYEELAADNILVRDAISGVQTAEVIEDYPEFHKGSSILVLQFDRNDQPIHIVWGIPKGKESPAVLVTAYRPDPGRWSDDFRKRIS